MRLVFAGLVVPCALLAQDAQRVIRGSLRDSTGAPVAFAIVQTTAQSRVVSDEAGQFEYRAVPRGELRLLVRRLGYRPLELKMDPSGDTTVTLTLARIPRQFDAIVVEATRLSERLDAVGFYERFGQRNKGIGTASFFTAEDIEQRNPMRVSQMLDQVSGVRVEKTGTGFNDWVIRGANGCEYTVYLNGTRISPKLGATLRPERIDYILEPSATSGIEVYPRASGAPPQFQMLNGTCGVVVFWTK